MTMSDQEAKQVGDELFPAVDMADPAKPELPETTTESDNTYFQKPSPETLLIMGGLTVLLIIISVAAVMWYKIIHRRPN